MIDGQDLNEYTTTSWEQEEAPASRLSYLTSGQIDIFCWF